MHIHNTAVLHTVTSRVAVRRKAVYYIRYKSSRNSYSAIVKGGVVAVYPPHSVALKKVNSRGSFLPSRARGAVPRAVSSVFPFFPAPDLPTSDPSLVASSFTSFPSSDLPDATWGQVALCGPLCSFSRKSKPRPFPMFFCYVILHLLARHRHSLARHSRRVLHARTPRCSCCPRLLSLVCTLWIYYIIWICFDSGQPCI